jgi:hypothetical protein
MTVLKFPLIDGSLLTRANNRDEVVERMAACLVKYDAFRTKGDAVRTLLAKRFPSLEVARYLDDARQLAMQSIVAREMSKP